ncbi:MAG: hypothetical protein QM765_39605 [Myxococcales bacterium]
MNRIPMPKLLSLLLLLALSASAVARADSTTTPPPQKHVPAPVLMELRALETAFDQALRHDCSPDRCVSKGCVYRDHAVVDQPRSSSLPGLGQSEGPGSVPVQEYLTEAECSFAHEKSVSQRDVLALVKRLEQRLVKGWLRVKIVHEQLEPISPSLSEPPPPKPEPEPVKPEPKVEPKPEPAAPLPPPEWNSKVALRELWLALLPHYSWMIAMALLTLSALFIIWGLRRLGKESLEEKALAAQLASGALGGAGANQAAQPESAPEAEAAADPSAAGPADGAASPEEAFVREQRQKWTEKMAQAGPAKDEGAAKVLREWLKTRQFPLLAKAVLVFGDRLSEALTSDGELAMRKVEFAEYLRTVAEAELPSDAEFFRVLDRQAIAASFLSQADAEIYRSLSEELGAGGIAGLVERLPPRHGSLLFAMAPPEVQAEVSSLLAPEDCRELAGPLLQSNRISAEERSHIFAALDAVRAGKPLPAPPPPPANGIVDRGQELDAAGALSALLPRVEQADRQELMSGSLRRAGGALPAWYEGILYPDMLSRLPAELRADVLLEVDVRGLAAWSSVQSATWQEGFLKSLAPTMQAAVRANSSFLSRQEQQQRARAGRGELAAALSRLAASGKISFMDLLA